jgi:hypothetical protein
MAYRLSQGYVKRSVLGLLLIAGWLCLNVSVSDAQMVRNSTPDTEQNSLLRSYTFFSNTIATSEEIPFGLNTAIEAPGRKSPFLAAALSLVIPGLGEYYVGDQIWRGAIFTLLEAGLWYGNITYTSRGDDSTAAFQDFAHKNWSSARYSDHLNKLLKDRKVDALITDPNDFDQINAAEDTLNSLQAMNFTHKLPRFGAQQYYELISKYNQFAAGWSDASCEDLSCSPLANRHAVMRYNMNYQYEVAQGFIWGIFLNHALSAVDAVLLAHDHNSALRVEGDAKYRTMPDGRMGYQMKAGMSYRF